MNDYNKNNFFSFLNTETGKKQYFLKIHKEMIEVNKEVFYVCYNAYRKELRDGRRDQEYGLVSYDAPLDDNDFTLLDLLGNNNNPIDDITYQEQKSKVKKIIKSLDQEEQDLLINLFIHEKTEQEMTEQSLVSRQMINKRKQKIIKKNEKIIKKWLLKRKVLFCN